MLVQGIYYNFEWQATIQIFLGPKISIRSSQKTNAICNHGFICNELEKVIVFKAIGRLRY